MANPPPPPLPTAQPPATTLARTLVRTLVAKLARRVVWPLDASVPLVCWAAPWFDQSVVGFSHFGVGLDHSGLLLVMLSVVPIKLWMVLANSGWR